MQKWGIFNASLLLNEHGHPPFFISKLKLSYDKYSVDKVWTKIYCHFYFRGITLNNDTISKLEQSDKRNTAIELPRQSSSRKKKKKWKNFSYCLLYVSFFFPLDGNTLIGISRFIWLKSFTVASLQSSIWPESKSGPCTSQSTVSFFHFKVKGVVWWDKNTTRQHNYYYY